MEAKKLAYTLNLNWDTEHDTAKGLMVHTFNDRVKVITDIKTGSVKVYKDGAIANLINAKGWKVADYTQFLSGIAAETAVLQLASAN